MNPLELKKKINKKRPKFKRQDAHKHKEVSPSWRKPRGLQSKMRIGQSKGAVVQPGYRGPKSVRGIEVRSGLLPVRITRSKDMDMLDAKQHGAVISSTVGTKKKLEIIKTAKEKGIKILNISADFEDKVKKKKEEKKKAADERKKRKEAAKPKKEEKKEAKKEEKTENKEKKELDKLLTKK